MKKRWSIILFLSLAWFLAGLFTFLKASKNENASYVLAYTKEETPSPSPSPTLSPSPTPSSTPTPSSSPTPTPVPVPQFTSEEINGFIERFSAQYGVSPNVLRHIALCESGFNPGATNGAYAGLFQFGPVTWMSYRKEMGEDPDISLRLNAEEAVQTGAYLVSLNDGYKWPNCNP